MQRHVGPIKKLNELVKKDFLMIKYKDYLKLDYYPNLFHGIRGPKIQTASTDFCLSYGIALTCFASAPYADGKRTEIKAAAFTNALCSLES